MITRAKYIIMYHLFHRTAQWGIMKHRWKLGIVFDLGTCGRLFPWTILYYYLAGCCRSSVGCNNLLWYAHYDNTVAIILRNKIKYSITARSAYISLRFLSYDSNIFFRALACRASPVICKEFKELSALAYSGKLTKILMAYSVWDRFFGQYTHKSPQMP